MRRLTVIVPILVIALLTGASARAAYGQQPVTPPGRYMDSATSVGLRPALSAAQFAAFLRARGPFPVAAR